MTTTSTHQHKTTVTTTSSVCQNTTTTTTTAWDGEQWMGGLEMPRWVFSRYYYYFLLTNYLHLGYMLLPPSTTLLWPHRPQPAPASRKDSLVEVASPSTMQAPMSHYDSLVLFFRFSLDHGGYNQHQRVITTCWCFTFTSPLTMAATTSTNESLWLIGAIFHFYLDHAGHRTLILTWCGITTSLHLMTMIISHPFFFLISILFYFISLL